MLIEENFQTKAEDKDESDILFEVHIFSKSSMRSPPRRSEG
jgi:hypothetical protein